MSNRVRIQAVGDIFHANIKAVTGVRAFPDHAHRRKYLELFQAELKKSGWRCLGYTILGTHVHVVVELTDLTLSSGFQRLNSGYSRWFNRRHGRTGALWQARFYDVLVEGDFQFLETQLYVALNAPRAGLVERPEDWQYCHYGSLIGRFPTDPLVDEDAILRVLASNRDEARRRMQAYVEEPDRRVRRQMLLKATSNRTQTTKRARATVPKRT